MRSGAEILDIGIFMVEIASGVCLDSKDHLKRRIEDVDYSGIPLRPGTGRPSESNGPVYSIAL